MYYALHTIEIRKILIRSCTKNANLEVWVCAEFSLPKLLKMGFGHLKFLFLKWSIPDFFCLASQQQSRKNSAVLTVLLLFCSPEISLYDPTNAIQITLTDEKQQGPTSAAVSRVQILVSTAFSSIPIFPFCACFLRFYLSLLLFLYTLLPQLYVLFSSEEFGFCLC